MLFKDCKTLMDIGSDITNFRYLFMDPVDVRIRILVISITNDLGDDLGKDQYGNY